MSLSRNAQSQFTSSNENYRYQVTVKIDEFEGKQQQLVAISCNNPESGFYGKEEAFLPSHWMAQALFSLGFNPSEIFNSTDIN